MNRANLPIKKHLYRAVKAEKASSFGGWLSKEAE
jgi:hypothetical protein